jgi:serine O-acetyltransferase/putative colanic acid biosynthesis acetyltransferase WcaB
MFRASRVLRGSDQPVLRSLGRIVSAVYMVLVRWTWGIDVPWTATVGPRFRVFHGTGLVVNSGSVLGSDVAVRHGVTIGARREGEPCPVLGDGVDVGAGAMVLGDVTIGDGAVVGAGAVVLTDVPAGGTVVGNPGRIL